MAEGTTQRRRLEPEVRRRLIISAALEVFASRDYGRTELADVAEAAEVGRPLIYHYFPGGKEDLYLAVLEHAWGEVLERFIVEPAGDRGIVPANLATYLDLIEERGPAVVVIRQSRLLEAAPIREATRGFGTAFARAMAVNQTGTDDPPAPVISALLGYLGFFEVLADEWAGGAITRAQVESLSSEMLPAIVQSAGRNAHGPTE